MAKPFDRRAPVNPVRRFLDKLIIGDGCWPWEGAKKPTGYGNFWDGKRVVGAHRYAYELLRGAIPAGLHLDHLCCNRACVNPWHLEPVSQGENTRRSYARRAI